jgi:tRNA threonylcarbamoyl adenosine modification protein (Sua5/YciO/YrdC/YwlC family)
MLEQVLVQLRAGGVVAIATESFFGLLADVESAAAISCLLSLKPRGADKGVPLLLPDISSWARLVDAIPPTAERLAGAFWPGALSIALPARADLDARIALQGSVAVRIPGPCPALDLVRAFSRPLTATSANLPGEPPAREGAAVNAAFAQAVADGRLLVVPGTAPGGQPSTIAVLDGTGLHIAREGAIPAAAVLSAATAP